MAMVPHERSLVKRLEGKPFALVGVNADESKEKQKDCEKDKKITWRSFFDGRGGAISDSWHVTGLPTIYVLDANGVVRYKEVRGEEMDKAVDKLIKEMEGKNKS
jgi:hypothetical protein